MQSPHPEQQYLHMLQLILDTGSERSDRTGVGTKAIFGHSMRFNLSDGFPVFTTKRVFWKTAFKEMLWMLSGGTNVRELIAQNVHIWSDWPYKKFIDAQAVGSPDKLLSINAFEQRILEDQAFADKWGDLGPVYGKQWRRWKTSDGREIDQVSQVIESLKKDPASRRILFDGWNVGELNEMALPPCHKHYQFFVDGTTNRLSGAMVQRSVDSYLGCAFNIANLAFLTTLLAHQTGYEPGEIVWFGMDVHLYLNHVEQAQKQLARTPKPFPKLLIKRKPESLFDYTIDDFEMVGYDPHPAISAPVAV
ncbi:thymidylate synthase [Alteromonas sp. 14N.309.X.WAT.G.H12]|uniref:thymidylate synthase n=1 Tax=Alteromonas sp. 14N.309.X.WAT.G.H12 TaxID=3120824 RepID=UPI002FD1EE04